MSPPRALVLAGFGINCQEETAAAWNMAGAQARVVHMNDLLQGHVSLRDFQVFTLPGGFSFGDDLGSGKVLANKFRFQRMPSGGTLESELRFHVERGGYVLGICNGFQALVKMGLLPGLEPGGQQATLTHNLSGRFEDRWVHCKVDPATHSPFLRGLDMLHLPVRHAEGRLLLRDESTRRAVLEQHLCCMEYCDAGGVSTRTYPANPNGSQLNCAALCDPSGRILGMMPHPEAFLSLYNHPDWPSLKRANPHISQDGQGLVIFRNLVANLEGSTRRPPRSSQH